MDFWLLTRLWRAIAASLRLRRIMRAPRQEQGESEHITESQAAGISHRSIHKVVDAGRILLFLYLRKYNYPPGSGQGGRACNRLISMAKNAAVAAKSIKMLEVLELFRIIVKSIRRHYRAVEMRAGISGAQLWALAHVRQHPGGQVGDLARALAVHPSTASNLARQLEGLGLVARRRRGADQRHVQLIATAKGRQTLDRAPQPTIGVLQQALSELPMTDLEDLHGQLERVVRLLKVKSVAARAIPLSEI